MGLYLVTYETDAAGGLARIQEAEQAMRDLPAGYAMVHAFVVTGDSASEVYERVAPIFDLSREKIIVSALNDDFRGSPSVFVPVTRH